MTDFFFLKMDCVGDADWNAMGDGLEGMLGVRDVLDVHDDGEEDEDGGRSGNGGRAN